MIRARLSTPLGAIAHALATRARRIAQAEQLRRALPRHRQWRAAQLLWPHFGSTD